MRLTVHSHSMSSGLRTLAILTGLILMLASCQKEEGGIRRQRIANGVWKLSVGTPDRFNLTSALERTPRLQAIDSMPRADSLPIPWDGIRMEVRDHRTFLRFPLSRDEKLYGLGLNFQSVERRGSILRLHVDHYGGSDNGRTHAPVPFFVSSKGYGALVNAARYIDVWCATGVRKDSEDPPQVLDRNTDRTWSAQPYSDNLEFLIPADGVEVLLFSAGSMLDVVRKFNLMMGGGTLPPRWGLGFWQRTPTLYTQDDVLREAREFKDNGFPLTVIGLEPGWMSGSYPCTYEWDHSRFPDPGKLISSLDTMGIKTNLWMNPGVSPKSALYERIEPLTATHTEWCGVLPDYSLDRVQSLMKDFWWEKTVCLGASGFKMDENDGYDSWLYPDVAQFPSGLSAEQVRQTYGALMQKTMTDLFHSHDRRTYGLVRAANAGTVSFPFVLYNDYYDHRGFITALVNSSFIGTLWTPEVRSSRTSEEWLRRMQTVVFSPLAMLNAWADGTKPWTFGDVAQKVRRYASLRMQLIPYLYTAFADYAFQGTPPIRAMNLEEGFQSEVMREERAVDATENPYGLAVRKEVRDQFMVGEDILVAPFFEGERSRQVILPPGKWYDFWTGSLAGEGEVITVRDETGYGDLPVYVRNGGIIPMYREGAELQTGGHSVIIRHYGDLSSTYSLYDDDGLTYGYERGEYVRIPVRVDVREDGTKQGTYQLAGQKQAYTIREITFDFESTGVALQN